MERRAHALLTTRGRRSGKLRRTALIYCRDGDRYLVVASNGGAKKHPSWYLNLAESPEVMVQVGAETFTARALTAVSEERPRLWQLMTSIWPEHERYQAKTERVIPLVILERPAVKATLSTVSAPCIGLPSQPVTNFMRLLPQSHRSPAGCSG